MLSLQEISDRIEIGMLLDAYAGAIDRVDMDALDAVFTPDAWIDYTPYGGPAGHYPEIRAFLAQEMPKYPAFQHLVANREITFSGDHATGRVMCFNPLVLQETAPDGSPQVAFLGLWYVDAYVRTAAGWRIARRCEEPCYAQGFVKAK
jgi:hypothetical protein